MAKDHEQIAYDWMLNNHTESLSRDDIKVAIRKQCGEVSENIMNISITRASIRLVKDHPELRK